MIDNWIVVGIMVDGAAGFLVGGLLGIILTMREYRKARLMYEEAKKYWCEARDTAQREIELEKKMQERNLSGFPKKVS